MSKHEELNHIMLQAIMNEVPIAMIDMPEILLRMKVVTDYSLEEIQKIFNHVLNRVV